MSACSTNEIVHEVIPKISARLGELLHSMAHLPPFPGIVRVKVALDKVANRSSPTAAAAQLLAGAPLLLPPPVGPCSSQEPIRKTIFGACLPVSLTYIMRRNY